MFVTPNFAWDHFNSQEKLKTMLMENFGVTNKEHYGMLWYLWSGQLIITCSLTLKQRMGVTLETAWLLLLQSKFVPHDEYVYTFLYALTRIQ